MNTQTAQTSFTIGFIGAGRLASSVMRGLVRSGFCQPEQIVASEPIAAARDALGKDLGIKVTAENAEIAEEADVIFLAVKPGVVLPALRELGARIAGKLVISLAAGTRIAAMEETAPSRFMRAMTNTTTTICQGATAIARGSRTTDADFERVREIFAAIGEVVEIAEEQIDAVTALSGSGPAFVYSVIEALAEGGKREGLSEEVALTLATQTVLGAAQFALESKLPPNELRDMVVTPGGTTAAGLAVMEKMKAGEALAGAVEAATKRGREMATENR